MYYHGKGDLKMFKEFYDIDVKLFKKCEELLLKYSKLVTNENSGPRHVDYQIMKFDNETLELNIVFIDQYDNYHSEFYLTEHEFLNVSAEEIVKNWILNQYFKQLL